MREPKFKLLVVLMLTALPCASTTANWLVASELGAAAACAMDCPDASANMASGCPGA